MSTTDALVYLLQAVYEAVDTGNYGARLFYADFSKGFAMIDHANECIRTPGSGKLNQSLS